MIRRNRYQVTAINQAGPALRPGGSKRSLTIGQLP